MAVYTQLRHNTIDTKTLYCYFMAKNGECTRGERCKYSHQWSQGMRTAEAPMKNRDGVSVAGMNRRILERSRVPHPAPRAAPPKNLDANWRPLEAPAAAPVPTPAPAPTATATPDEGLSRSSTLLPSPEALKEMDLAAKQEQTRRWIAEAKPCASPALAPTPVLFYSGGPEWDLTRTPSPPDWRFHCPVNTMSLLLGSYMIPPIQAQCSPWFGAIGDGRPSSMGLKSLNVRAL